MEPVFLRTPYNYDMFAASAASGLSCEGPSLTQQQFRDETDINEIVRRFGITGKLPENLRAPQYADFEGVVDYHTALNAIRAAGESFMAMPADVRLRFQNDPQLFLEFVNDERNWPEAKKLGLVMAGPPPDLTAPVQPPPPAPM